MCFHNASTILIIRKNHSMKSIFLFFSIYVFLIGTLDAQLLDEPQRRILHKLGIKKIEKTILSDSINSDYLWTEQEVNHLGFIIKQTYHNERSRIVVQEFDYLHDSILIESQYIHQNEPNIKTKYSKNTYTKDLKRKTFSFYDGDRLQMRSKFKYTKDGELEFKEERLYGIKGTNSYSGKKKYSYKYNAEGKVETVQLKDKTKGKTETKIYKNIYKSDPYTVENYLISNNSEEDQIIDREVFDDQNRLKVSEHFSRRGNSIMQLANRKMEIKKGESQRKEYFYDDRGLIILEVMSANRNQNIEIRYDYF